MLAALAASAVLPAWTAPPLPLARPVPAGGPKVAAASRFAGPAVMVIAAYALIQGSHAGLYGFASISWTARGFSEALVGALWAVGLIVEIALFARMAGLGRSLPVATGLIVAGGLAAVIRWAGMATEPGPALALFYQCLHGVSYAATHLGAVAALDVLASEGKRARMQGKLAAATAACMAGFTFIAGRLYATSPPLAFAAMLVPAGLGLAFAILVFIRARRSQA
jgi:PPP family 3-phenylpropionic acid transporter